MKTASKQRSKSVQLVVRVLGLMAVTLAGFALLIWLTRFAEHQNSVPTLSPAASPASENDDLSSEVRKFYDGYIQVAREGLESGLNNTESGSLELRSRLDEYVAAQPLASDSLNRAIKRRVNADPVLCTQQYSLEAPVVERARLSGSTATVLVHQRDSAEGDFETQIRVNLTRSNQVWLITSITCL